MKDKLRELLAEVGENIKKYQVLADDSEIPGGMRTWNAGKRAYAEWIQRRLGEILEGDDCGDD